MTSVFVLCFEWPNQEQYEMIDVYSSLEKAKAGTLNAKNAWRGEPVWSDHWRDGFQGDVADTSYFYMIYERTVDVDD
jgi:hypothetical protein